MLRKEKIITFFFLLVVLFSCLLLVFGKINRLGRKYIINHGNEEYVFGDSWLNSGLSDFKIKIPLANKSVDKDRSIDSKVIAIGDSFYYMRLGSDLFTNLLQESLGEKVVLRGGMAYNPIEILENMKYKPQEKKVLMVEVVERFSLIHGLRYDDMIVEQLNEENKTKIDKYIELVDELSFQLFDFKETEYFFKRNKYLLPIRFWFKDLNYKLINRIDYNIGALSKTPPMLFLSEEVLFNEKKIVEEEVVEMANNLKELSDYIEKKYNLILIYTVIPNKYSIYYDFVEGGRYNGFIPRLQKELSELGVKHVNIYDELKKYREEDDSDLLYYSNDTHYTALGKNIYVDISTKVINNVLNNL